MPNRQEIERLAYSLWERDGRPQGRDLKHYFEAERTLRERESKDNATIRAEQFQRPAAASLSPTPRPQDRISRNRKPPTRGS